MSDVDNIVDMAGARAGQARTTAVQDIDSSPDEAARSMELSRATGVPASVIAGDLESFESQHKGYMAGQIIKNNPYIQEYVNSHPLGAKLSSDDYGNLDNITKSTRKLQDPITRFGAKIADSTMDHAIKGFKEGFGEGGIGSWLPLESIQKYPLAAAAWSVLAAPIEGGLRAGAGVLTGIKGGVQGGAQSFLEQMGYTPSDAEKKAGELAEMVEYHIMGMSGVHAPHIGVDEARAKRMVEGLQAAEPYIRSGKEPPYGLHPAIDEIKEAQHDLDLKNLDEAQKDVQSSLTRERDPDTAAEYVKLHVGDKQIGVSAEAVRKLYGDKLPEPEDGKLGFVTNLRDQLDLAEASGGDVMIPLADWLAKVEPDIAKELHDDIRIRRGGVTSNEVVNAKAMVEAYHGSPHDFEAFSMEKIGTGEGAQSYGHGLYFAENPQVAESYARPRTPGGMNSAGMRLNDQTGRNRYRVRIHADKEQFLDWDKTMHEQPELVAKLAAHPELAEAIIKGGATGEDFYGDLSQQFSRELLRADKGDFSAPKAQERVSKLLHEAGIPGIKYLDKHSRRGAQEVKMYEDALARMKERLESQPYLAEHEARLEKAKQRFGNPTSNFVLFDDSLIEITHKNDLEVIRQAAKLDPITKTMQGYDYEGESGRGYIHKAKDGSIIHAVPTTKMTAAEKDLSKLVEDTAKRILGKEKGLFRLFAADRIFFKGDRQVRGLNVTAENAMPVIAYTLSDRPERVIRHEAIHQLISWGLFSKDELDLIRKEATAKNENGVSWLDKHHIKERYADQKLDQDALIEEAFAEEFGEWGNIRSKAEAQVAEYGKIEKVFEKLHRFFTDLYSKIAEYFGHSPSVEELFEKIESGKIGERSSPEPVRGGAKADEDAFKQASAIGMTIDQYNRYQKLIEKRTAEDQAWIEKRAEKSQKQRLTKEWKANHVEMHSQVVDEINARPDFVAKEFFEKGGAKIASDRLTPEQKASLPKDWVGDRGMDPDDIAGIFGYASGRSMVDQLSVLQRGIESSGMRPEAYKRRLVEAETERGMELKYGDLRENIMQEARDQALSETQEEILHEEVMALAAKAGAELSLDKTQLKRWVEEGFEKTPLRGVDTETYLAQAGRAGREAEMALLKDTPAEAFRAKQKQYLAFQMANLAKKLEKEQERFDRTAKQFSQREVASVEPEYTNWVHDILMRVGKPVRRSGEDLQNSIAHQEHDSLGAFVVAKEGMLRELPVADFLLDPKWSKSLDDMTVEEFRAVSDSVKALVKNGREERKIYRAGEAADLAKIKTKMIEQLAEFKEKKYDAEGKRTGPIAKRISAIRTYAVSHLQMESIFNRWDRGDPRGVFTQYIMRDLSDAANSEAALERKYGRELGAVADKAKLGEILENPVFKSPLNGTPMQMTRKNLRAVMLNMGNKQNFDKLVKGYKAEPETVRAWVNQHATKEDWDWAQKIGDIFAGIKSEADVMSRHLSGVEAENIPIDPIQTPHGDYKGWYYPIIYHPLYEGASKKLMGGDALEQDNYHRASTPKGYTKARTGYIAPLALDLDMMPVRMRQMIHDIAFRPSVVNASKIFYDKDVRKAITKYYGADYSKMMVPYLKDVANSANYRDDMSSMFARVSESLRQNMIATLIGFNPGTVLKHGPTAAVNSITEVGGKEFLKAVQGLFSKNESTGESNWSYAMENSQELQRRHRHYNETLGGAQEKLLGTESLRETLIKVGSYPVAMSDLLSAVPTWMAQYDKSMREHGVHGDAISEADRAVRRAHGSTVVTNRPGVVRKGGAFGSWLTSLYGFFNHIMNRQYELAWRAGDTLGMVKEGEYKKAMSQVPTISTMLFSYVLFPALVEELVTPLPDDHHESWGKKAVKGLTYSLSASWVGVRDLASGMLRGTDPSVGLISTAYKTASDVARDLSHKNGPVSRERAGLFIQHSAAALGAATGLVNAQEGKALRFTYNAQQGIERPEGPWGWMVGLRHGTLKHHSRTLQEYMRGK